MYPISLSYGQQTILLHRPSYPKQSFPGFFNKRMPVFQLFQEETLVSPNGYLYLEFFSSDINKQRQILYSYELSLKERIDAHSLIVRCHHKRCPVSLCHQLQQQETQLRIAEPDFYSTQRQYSFQVPRDNLLKSQWYLKNDGRDHINNKNWFFRKRADAKVVEAWKLLWETTGQMGSDKITIAVIDKGFDLSHPDLKDKIVAPKDFFNATDQAFRIFTTLDGDRWVSNADHGTSCAGIALASANGKGIVGVAPNARFMPIAYNSASGLDLRRMFRYIMQQGGDIISCSFGTLGLPMDSLTAKALHDCATKGRNGKGCVICVATGNDAAMLINKEFATHPDVIAVGASTSEDTFAPYTNRTINMSVVAPGGYGFSGTMTTTDVGFVNDPNTGIWESVGKGKRSEPYYRHNAEGTSFSCPLVAGIAALILSANPELTAKEVKHILETTADKIGDPADYDMNDHSVKFGYGRVNAANAVRMAMGLPLRNYRKAASPDVSSVPPFSLNIGTSLTDALGPGENAVCFRYPIAPHLTGHSLYIELDAPIGHDPGKCFALFVQKGHHPDFLTGDYLQQSLMNEDMQAKLHLSDLQASDYYVLVKCLHQGQWVKNGGAFELNFRIEKPIIDSLDPGNDSAIAAIDPGDISRLG